MIRFNLICQDGGIFRNSLLFCNRGLIKSYRDLHNALKWEKQIIVQKAENSIIISSKDYYEAEIVNN